MGNKMYEIFGFLQSFSAQLSSEPCNIPTSIMKKETMNCKFASELTLADLNSELANVKERILMAQSDIRDAENAARQSQTSLQRVINTKEHLERVAKYYQALIDEQETESNRMQFPNIGISGHP